MGIRIDRQEPSGETERFLALRGIDLDPSCPCIEPPGGGIAQNGCHLGERNPGISQRVDHTCLTKLRR